MAISLEKLQQQAPSLVNLRKSLDSTLHRHAGLTNHIAKVALALDYSGSMSDLYANGSIQALAEKVLALGTVFDDDGEIDVFIFESSAHYVGSLSIANYQQGIQRLLANHRMGSTNYAAVIDLIRKHYRSEPQKKGVFGRLFGPSSQARTFPSYVMFITDGEPDSRSAAEAQIRDAAKEPIFWQFMGIGSSTFDFLSKLDTMRGRVVDNANFFAVADPKGIPDAELYQRMLAEYPDWLIKARKTGILA